MTPILLLCLAVTPIYSTATGSSYNWYDASPSSGSGNGGSGGSGGSGSGGYGGGNNAVGGGGGEVFRKLTAEPAPADYAPQSNGFIAAAKSMSLSASSGYKPSAAGGGSSGHASNGGITFTAGGMGSSGSDDRYGAGSDDRYGSGSGGSASGSDDGYGNQGNGGSDDRYGAGGMGSSGSDDKYGHGSDDLQGDILGSADLGLTLSKESYDLLSEILGHKEEDDDDSSSSKSSGSDNSGKSSTDDNGRDDSHYGGGGGGGGFGGAGMVEADAKSVIADILVGGSTKPATSESSSSGTVILSSDPSKGSSQVFQPVNTITTLDLAYQKYTAAAITFSQAQKAANDAEDDVATVQAAVSSEGGEVVARAVATSRAGAVRIITTARTEARTNVLTARRDYVSALAKAHTKISEMRQVEAKFRALACAFAKTRHSATTAIVGLKKVKTLTGGNGGVYASAVSQTKTRVTKMKSCEKLFIAAAKELKTVRHQAQELAKGVRKAAFNMAQICASATVQVSSAVELATESVSKAITVAKATSVAKAVATVNAAEDDRDDAYDDLRAAALVLAESKANLEAIAAKQGVLTRQEEDDSYGKNVGFGSSDDRGYDDSSSRIAASASSSYPSNANSAAASIHVASGGGSDKTDTYAKY